MEKKYKLLKHKKVFTTSSGEWVELRRIVAIRDFGDIKAGDKGGYIESENNLSHNGNCWVYDGSIVYGDTEIEDDAKIYGKSEIHGYDNCVADKAKIYDSEVYDAMIVCGNAELHHCCVGSTKMCQITRGVLVDVFMS